MRGTCIYATCAHWQPAVPLRPFALVAILLVVLPGGCRAFATDSPSPTTRSAGSEKINILVLPRLVRVARKTVSAKKNPRTSLSFKQSDGSDDGISTTAAKKEKEGTAGDGEGIVPYLSIVLPLLLVYISNQWSRSSLYYLVNFSDSPDATPFTAMNVELGFTQAQYGALASVAFTALFAVAS